jgi:hypothetical protein
LDGLDRTRLYHQQVAVDQDEDGCVRINVSGKMAADGGQPKGECVFSYVFLPNGALQIQFDFKPLHLLTRLPRLGWVTRLDRDYRHVTWYGRGPHECYADRMDSAFVDRYTAETAELFHPYLMPQENGNRTDVRWLEIIGHHKPTIRIQGRPTFNFSIHHCSLENLTQAQHTNEVIWEADPYLYIDFAQTGLGSNACGPDTLPEYRLAPNPYQFSFLIYPGTKI